MFLALLVRTPKTEDARDTRERSVDEVSAADMTRSSSLTSGPVALVLVPPIVIPPMELC